MHLKFELYYIINITDLQPLKDRLSELEDKIGNQTLKINLLEAENENQTLKFIHVTLRINQLEAENENKTLKITQLETELEMLQPENYSYGNFDFLLSLSLAALNFQ